MLSLRQLKQVVLMGHWGSGHRAYLQQSTSLLIASLLVVLCLSIERVAGQGCPLQAPALTAERLSALCTSSRSPACTIYKLCNDPKVSPPIFYSICNTTRIATSLCLDDAAIAGSIPECSECVLWGGRASGSVSGPPRQIQRPLACMHGKWHSPRFATLALSAHLACTSCTGSGPS